MRENVATSMWIPILWRYLLGRFFQVLLLSVAGFIAVLLVWRFQEIARFATSGASVAKVALFALYQIPHILPLALPISCLIASLLLFQHMSRTHEITALRASGLGLKMVLAPFLFASTCLFFLNFLFVSEIAPPCRVKSKMLIYKMAMANPLFLLQKESLLRLHNAFFDMRTLRAGRKAEDVVLAVKNNGTERIVLIAAKELALKEKLLAGKDVAVISTAAPKKEGHFDSLVLENQREMDTLAAPILPFVETANWHATYSHLPLRSIFVKSAVEKTPFWKGPFYAIAHRLSLSLAAFAFTWMGIAFGLGIARSNAKKNVLIVISLAMGYFACYAVAHSMRHSTLAAPLLFLLSPLCLLACCTRPLRHITRGIE